MNNNSLFVHVCIYIYDLEFSFCDLKCSFTEICLERQKTYLVCHTIRFWGSCVICGSVQFMFTGSCKHNDKVIGIILPDLGPMGEGWWGLVIGIRSAALYASQLISVGTICQLCMHVSPTCIRECKYDNETKFSPVRTH